MNRPIPARPCAGSRPLAPRPRSASAATSRAIAPQRNRPAPGRTTRDRESPHLVATAGVGAEGASVASPRPGGITDVATAYALSLRGFAVTPEEIKSIEPTLAGQYHGGFYTPSDSTGDIHRFTFGLAQAAQRRGVECLYAQQVSQLRPEAGGGVTLTATWAETAATARSRMIGGTLPAHQDDVASQPPADGGGRPCYPAVPASATAALSKAMKRCMTGVTRPGSYTHSTGKR